MNYLEKLETELVPLRQQLQSHSLYTELHSVEDIKLFMEYHVYAVWDFMSLLKALQRDLTCVSVPWCPPKDPVVSRFINEIVHGEESDLNEKGEPRSHFEMYVDAMEQVRANTELIHSFIEQIRKGKTPEEVMVALDLPESIQEFVKFTFEVISRGKPHEIAAAFTFGREDVIPDMFLEIIKGSGENSDEAYSKLLYYLQRHIELDGDEHGPIALKMVSMLAEDSSEKWEEIKAVSISALNCRIRLWDGILQAITSQRELVL